MEVDAAGEGFEQDDVGCCSSDEDISFQREMFPIVMAFADGKV